MSRLLSWLGKPGGVAENPLLEQLAERSTSEQPQSTAEGQMLEPIDALHSHLQFMVIKMAAVQSTCQFLSHILEVQTLAGILY